MVCLPVGDNGILVDWGNEPPPPPPPPPPALSGNLGGSIFQGALGNGPKSLFKFDPINIIWSLAINILCMCVCVTWNVSFRFVLLCYFLFLFSLSLSLFFEYKMCIRGCCCGCKSSLFTMGFCFSYECAFVSFSFMLEFIASQRQIQTIFFIICIIVIIFFFFLIKSTFFLFYFY